MTKFPLVIVAILGFIPAALAGSQTTITLLAKDAKLSKGGVDYNTDEKMLGKWEWEGASATWPLKGMDIGTYNVTINYALITDTKARKFKISCGGNATTVEGIDSTGGWTTFVKKDVGTIQVTAEETSFSITALEIPHKQPLMNLVDVTLKKVP